MHKLIPIILLLATIINTSAMSQTIHKDDLGYFIGSFVKNGTQHKNSIDCSKFIDWMIIKPNPGEKKRDFNKIKYSEDIHWIYNWELPYEKNCKIEWNKYLPDVNGYVFFVMMDFWGHEKQVNVLTVWKPVSRDSLRFYCGQVGDFNTGIGRAKVEKIAVFPDSSLLLVVQLGGEGYNGFSFFRGVTPCDFKEFYSKSWLYEDIGDTFTQVFYNFEHLSFTCVVTEVSEYVRKKYRDEGYELSIDSASAKVINLWEMIKK